MFMYLQIYDKPRNGSSLYWIDYMYHQTHVCVCVCVCTGGVDG